MNKLGHIKALHGMSEEEWRFWGRVDTSGDCWLWTGAVNPRGGYGAVHIGDRVYRAPRVAYEFITGPVPEGLFVLHACDNRLCVNPAHLRVGTRAENIADMTARSRNKRTYRPAVSAARQADLVARYAAGGISIAALARAFDVNFLTAQRILRRHGIDKRPVSNNS